MAQHLVPCQYQGNTWGQSSQSTAELLPRSSLQCSGITSKNVGELGNSVLVYPACSRTTSCQRWQNWSIAHLSLVYRQGWTLTSRCDNKALAISTRAGLRNTRCWDRPLLRRHQRQRSKSIPDLIAMFIWAWVAGPPRYLHCRWRWKHQIWEQAVKNCFISSFKEWCRWCRVVLATVVLLAWHTKEIDTPKMTLWVRMMAEPSRKFSYWEWTLDQQCSRQPLKLQVTPLKCMALLREEAGTGMSMWNGAVQSQNC